MDEKVQFNIRLDKDTKDEWEEYVGPKGENTTLAEFVRTSVQKRIAQLNNGDELTDSSPAISSDIDEIKSELERIRKDVRWLREQYQDEYDISDLANRVRDELETLPKPTGPVDVPENVDMDEKEYRRFMGAQSIITPDDSEGDEDKQTLSALGERVGATPEEVKDAIDQLKADYLPVVEIEIQGEIHYFMEH